MADPQSSSETSDLGSRIWRGLRDLLSGAGAEPSLRASLEEAIDEHVGEPDDRDDLSAVERTMLKNLLHFGEHDVDDVAVPRADIVAFDIDDSFAELVALFREAGHSRMPVFRDSLDLVVGMIHVKDVYAVIAETFDDNVSSAPFTDFKVETLLRPVLYVPSSMRVLDLLARMRAGRTHMAIVVDEFGGTDGLVTIEDHQIVGGDSVGQRGCRREGRGGRLVAFADHDPADIFQHGVSVLVQATGADPDHPGRTVRVFLETDDGGFGPDRITGPYRQEPAAFGIAEVGDGVEADVGHGLAEDGVKRDQIVERCCWKAGGTGKFIGGIERVAGGIERVVKCPFTA